LAEEGLDFASERRVARALNSEKSRACSRIERTRGVEQA
jgi:hypothetical protein